MRPHKLFTPLLFASGLAVFSSSSVLAQTGEYHNTTETINGSYASSFANFEIGPNADITVNGDWYVTANTVKISPTAKIGGTGTLHLMTPTTYGGTAAATALTAGGLMGNSLGITCKVSLENNQGVALAGGTDLVMGNTLAFAKTGAHLTLGAQNLKFTATGSPVTTAPPATPAFGGVQGTDATADFRNAYAVTNGAGSVYKLAVANAAAFTFPVGFTRNSGATSDYTPAQVTNNAASRDIQARVENYASSAPVEGNTTKGIDRTWQIQGSAAGNAAVALTHNAGSEGTAFNRNAAFVTQNTTAGGWSVGTPSAATTPDYTHTGTFNVPAGTDGASFSKSSDAVNSLNPTFTVAAKLFLQGPYLAGGPNAMTNLIQTGGGNSSFFGCKLPTTDPYGLGATYSDACNVSGAAGSVTDWIREELWGFDAVGTGTLLQSRAALLKTDGQAVSTDGGSLGFRITPGFTNYRVVVRHRNHMAVSSQNLTGVVDGASIAYNFTDASTKARNELSGTQQQANIGGVYSLFTGDINQEGVIDAVDNTLLNNKRRSGTFFDVYDIHDLNHEGTVDIQDNTILNNNRRLSTLLSETFFY